MSIIVAVLSAWAGVLFGFFFGVLLCHSKHADAAVSEVFDDRNK